MLKPLHKKKENMLLENYRPVLAEYAVAEQRRGNY